MGKELLTEMSSVSDFSLWYAIRNVKELLLADLKLRDLPLLPRPKIYKQNYVWVTFVVTFLDDLHWELEGMFN